ncbi:hypothetical protein HWV01_18320 [Moritella sp. 5]|uniref:hypothetical protein n=1 Tax=Moritella sp. 5 TaxID=2746231 RepID=UPI001BA86660|nr:hypothetical protein [Moritella sp. 5]QUM82094.1 hypothetical protein HWV01_18320 [Moritella sp. 5]
MTNLFLSIFITIFLIACNDDNNNTETLETDIEVNTVMSGGTEFDVSQKTGSNRFPKNAFRGAKFTLIPSGGGGSGHYHYEILYNEDHVVEINESGTITFIDKPTGNIVVKVSDAYNPNQHTVKTFGVNAMALAAWTIFYESKIPPENHFEFCDSKSMHVANYYELIPFGEDNAEPDRLSLFGEYGPLTNYSWMQKHFHNSKDDYIVSGRFLNPKPTSDDDKFKFLPVNLTTGKVVLNQLEHNTYVACSSRI